MRSRQEVEQLWNNLQYKKERILAEIKDLQEQLQVKKTSLKKINIRCDKIERHLWPERKLSQTKSERFRSLARKILPAKLYEDMWAEAQKGPAKP